MTWDKVAIKLKEISKDKPKEPKISFEDRVKAIVEKKGK